MCGVREDSSVTGTVPVIEYFPGDDTLSAAALRPGIKTVLMRNPIERGFATVRHRIVRTMYGWLPHGKGFCDLRRLVGCGHVFGVSSAACPRALSERSA